MANDIVELWISLNNKIGELQKEIETQKLINQGLQQRLNESKKKE